MIGAIAGEIVVPIWNENDALVPNDTFDDATSETYAMGTRPYVPMADGRRPVFWTADAPEGKVVLSVAVTVALPEVAAGSEIVAARPPESGPSVAVAGWAPAENVALDEPTEAGVGDGEGVAAAGGVAATGRLFAVPPPQPARAPANRSGATMARHRLGTRPVTFVSHSYVQRERFPRSIAPCDRNRYGGKPYPRGFKSPM